MNSSPIDLLAKLPLPADEKWKGDVPFLPVFVAAGEKHHFENISTDSAK